MNMHNATPRGQANAKATEANQHHAKACEANNMRRYYDRILMIIRKYKFPWQWYTLLYVLSLVADAILMAPIIRIVVDKGFGSSTFLMQALGMGIYIAVVAACILFIARGFIRSWVQQYITMEVDLAQHATPGTARSILEADIRKMDNGAKRLAVVLSVFLGAFVLALALVRNWILNGLVLEMGSVLAWLQILWPLGAVALMTLLGRYKELAYDIYRYKQKIRHYEEVRVGHQQKSDALMTQAFEQDDLATKARDLTAPNADLVALKQRSMTRSVGTSNFYDIDMEVRVIVTDRGKPVPSVPVMAWSSKNERLIRTTGSDGVAHLSWSAEEPDEHLVDISIAGLKPDGDHWANGAILQVELYDIAPDQKDRARWAALESATA
jgi:hypothetical protein